MNGNKSSKRVTSGTVVLTECKIRTGRQCESSLTVGLTAISAVLLEPVTLNVAKGRSINISTYCVLYIVCTRKTENLETVRNFEVKSGKFVVD
jgi:hypothetical protein